MRASVLPSLVVANRCRRGRSRRPSRSPKEFRSSVVTKGRSRSPGRHSDRYPGAKRLHLEVSDGGNGSGYDWADWIEPRLVGPKGELKLTELEWGTVEGRAQVGKNQGGGDLRCAGRAVAYGIGTHAPSRISYRLPKGYETFRAQGGLDNGGTDQDGSTTSVVFRAFTGRAGRAGTHRRVSIRRALPREHR